MSNGHQFRQDMLKHAAQHKHQFDAFGQNARNSARAATERHQATSRAWAQQAAQNAQQGYDDIRRRSEAQARRIGHQPFEAWHGDDPGTDYEPEGSNVSAGKVLLGVIAVLMFLGWLAWMGWLGWIIISR